MILALFFVINLAQVHTAQACVSAEGWIIPCDSLPSPHPVTPQNPKKYVAPVESFADDFAKDLVYDGFGISGDLLSTAAFRHWCPTRCAEGNPLVFSGDALVPLKLGAGTGVAAAQYMLRRKGHGMAASIARWAYLTINAALTVRNARLAIRGDR